MNVFFKNFSISSVSRDEKGKVNIYSLIRTLLGVFGVFGVSVIVIAQSQAVVGEDRRWMIIGLEMDDFIRVHSVYVIQRLIPVNPLAILWRS